MVGEILVLGAGMNGLATAMLLARDGHSVTVIERDPAPPPERADDAWRKWERRSVNQFRLPHIMLPQWRALMEHELPAVLAELEAWGGLRINFISALPHERTGGWREGDEEFETVTGRRPVVEAAMATVAARTPDVDVRRGLAVTGLVADGDGSAAVPCVRGTFTSSGETFRADLVVDASGRRSALPAWLDAIGAAPPFEEREDSGFVYYARTLQSRDGSVPAPLAVPLTSHASVSILTLPADNGTWAVGFLTSASDRALRRLRDPATWERAMVAYPLTAHWADGEPISEGIEVIAAIEDRYRSLSVDGRRVATGLVAVGDSWACSNPSRGRGTSIGLLHARILRDTLREVDLVDHESLAVRFDEATRAEVEPHYRATLHSDRHRLAEIDADIAGRPYEPDEPSWKISKALANGAAYDADLVRASLRASADDVLAAPGLLERVIAVGSNTEQYVYPGPTREELLALVTAG